MLLAALLALAIVNGDEKARQPTRSIYVPVEVKTCEHLRDAVLYQNEQVVGTLPAKRIFQFTYYPGLSRIEPTEAELRVEGRRLDGSDFVGRVAVTPWSIYTANQKIELAMSKQLDKMKFTLDVRYHPVRLRMRCSDSCGKTPSLATSSPSSLEQ
jgi:hypothetical protein